jgi:hypothetical protein
MEKLIYVIFIAMAVWVVVGAVLCFVGSWGLNKVLQHRGNPSAKTISWVAGIAMFLVVVLGNLGTGGAASGFAGFILIGYALISVYALGLRNA